MNKATRARPAKFEHYLNRARVAAERSTCLRRAVGAIIVKNDVEVSSGYVGSPRGMDHCIDLKSCLRIELRIPSGQQYELCRAVHAEQNAIINAARSGINILGGEMYISSQRTVSGYGKTGKRRTIYGPCLICKKEIINAGLVVVHMRETSTGQQTYTLDRLKELVEEDEKRARTEQLRLPRR